MIRAALALTAGLGLASVAPLQCGSHETPPEQRTEDTAGDALWDLAAKFRAEHDDAAAKETLRYLVQQYPSSRHATAAKDVLAQMGEGAPSASPARDD